jgi:hypothetical protein
MKGSGLYDRVSQNGQYSDHIVFCLLFEKRHILQDQSLMYLMATQAFCDIHMEGLIRARYLQLLFLMSASATLRCTWPIKWGLWTRQPPFHAEDQDMPGSRSYRQSDPWALRLQCSIDTPLCASRSRAPSRGCLETACANVIFHLDLNFGAGKDKNQDAEEPKSGEDSANLQETGD